MTWVSDTPTVDHSTLAAYGLCPSRAAMVQCKIIYECSRELLAGQVVHDALSEAVRHYVKFGLLTTSYKLADIVKTVLQHTRPDLQPECLDAIRPSLNAWAAWLSEEVRPSSIMRHDGGEGEHCGQLTRECEGVNVTSEVDLLLATNSPEVVRIVDYKSGWKPWTEDAIANSLQFQLHAWLVLENYPEVQSVDVQVWMTRKNLITRRVRFERRQESTITSRIAEAVKIWQRWHDKPLHEIPIFPVADKCETCPAVLFCDGSRTCGVTQHPENMVDELTQCYARIAKLESILGEVVDARGTDIVSPLGNCYGTGKPKKDRKPVKSLYQTE